MIYPKLLFGGFQRRGLEAIVATLVLALANVIVASAMMVIAGSRIALSRAEQNDRPDIIQVKGRFNRALFETPRNGNLPPLTLPVYEPLIDSETLVTASNGATVLKRQSLLRNVVSDDSFLNLYVFGIEPELERQVSKFFLARGRFLRRDDEAAGVIDWASARSLGIDLGDLVAIRKADGVDLQITIVDILDLFELHDAPPRTIEAPTTQPEAGLVTSGILVTLHTSEQIFGRAALTDALVIAPRPAGVPDLADGLRQAFRLEPGVFVRERFSLFSRKVHDFTLTLTFFSMLATTTAALAGSFLANLLHDVYAERQQQLAVLDTLGFSPARRFFLLVAVGLGIASVGAVAGSFSAIVLDPKQFSMPSLMADLGAVEPRFDALALTAIVAVSILPAVLALAPTVWRLSTRSVAAALLKPAT